MQIFVNTKYDFVKWRFAAVAFSVVFMLIGVGFYFKRGINWGIDFAGGANIVIKFKDAVPLDRLRGELADASIQQYGKAEDRAVLIRLPQLKKEGDYAGEEVEKLHNRMNPEAATKYDLNYRGSDNLAGLLMQADPDLRGTNPNSETHYRMIARSIVAKRSELGMFSAMNQATGAPGVSSATARVLNERAFVGRFNVLNQETVGPQVGAQLQQKAFWAIILSSLAMGIYIWLRFDFVFGVAAMLCIVHDVLISLTFLLLLNLEFPRSVRFSAARVEAP